MAHKGLLYPCVFRRDFNLNVDTNRDGWGNRELVFWPDFGTTGPATFWANSHWDCGPGTLHLANSILWESEHVLKFGVHWFTQFEVLISGGVQLLPILRLVTTELGVLLELQYALERRPVVSATTGIAPEIVIWDPAGFDSEPTGALGAQWRWKFWADGAPH